MLYTYTFLLCVYLFVFLSSNFAGCVRGGDPGGSAQNPYHTQICIR